MTEKDNDPIVIVLDCCPLVRNTLVSKPRAVASVEALFNRTDWESPAIFWRVTRLWHEKKSSFSTMFAYSSGR